MPCQPALRPLTWTWPSLRRPPWAWNTLKSAPVDAADVRTLGVEPGLAR